MELKECYLGKIDVVVSGELGDLLGRKASEAEHTDLVGDVIPVVGVTSALKQF